MTARRSGRAGRTPDLKEAPRVAWRLILDCATEAKAQRLARAAAGRLKAKASETTIERYLNGGFMARLDTELTSRRWGDAVIEAMDLATRVAQGWTVLGDPRKDLSGWANRPSLPGIIGAEWRLTLPATRSPRRSGSRPPR